MDKAGIGTDATMHDHIKKLLDRFYATKDSNTRFSPTNLGEALVMGYDDMGYELWKPNLRSTMECDMKAVSVGTKSKADVLATCLLQMKACFLDARVNKVKLFEAMEIFFQRSNRSGAGDQNTVGDVVRRCNVCQESDMVLRRKPDGNFMVGCLGYPQCRNVVWLPGPVSEAVVTTNVCTTCTPGPVFMIQFKFRRLEIPAIYNANHLGCIGGCDDILKQIIADCGTGSRIPTVPARGRGGTTTSSNSAQRSIPRQQSACTHCRQIGHSSVDCPSRRPHSQGINPQTGIEEDSVPCSTCGAPCPLRTANTANNRGRKFYSCQSRDCQFFVWEDSLNGRSGPSISGGSSARGRGRARARGRGSGRSNLGGGRSNLGGRHNNNSNNNNNYDVTFVSATGHPLSGTRCFVCGDPSHLSPACPNRAM